MSQQKTMTEAMRELSNEFHKIIDPPMIRWIIEPLTRHIERHPRFYRAIRVLPK